METSGPKLVGVFNEATGHFLSLPILSAMLMMQSGSGTSSGIANNNYQRRSPMDYSHRLLVNNNRFSGPTMTSMTKRSSAWKYNEYNKIPPVSASGGGGGTFNNKAYISIGEVLTRNPGNEIKKKKNFSTGILPGKTPTRSGEGTSGLSEPIGDQQSSFSSLSSWPRDRALIGLYVI